MTSYSKKALKLAAEDVVFARIIAAPEPNEALQNLKNYMWLKKTEKFVTSAWVPAALDAREGIFKEPTAYSSDEIEKEEITEVQNYFRRFNLYSDLLAGVSDKPFTDYLYDITVEDFRSLLQDKRGMDAAREIQILYQDGVLASDLGGSQLHRYMEQLGLPYIPTVNHLNTARRGEIKKGRYNMANSRAKGEKYL